MTTTTSPPPPSEDEADRDEAGPDDEPAGPSLRRRLVAPALAAVVLQALVSFGDVLPAVDTLVYLESGRNLIEGNGFTRFGGPELHFPPLVPAALGGLLEITGDEMHAIRIWELFTGLVLAAAVTALARRLFDDDRTTVAAAWIGGALSGLGPLLVRRGSGSEGITAALVIAALVVVLGPPASAGGGRRRLTAMAGGGMLAGLAYLARPEALLPALVMGLALLIDGWRRRERGLDPSAAIAFGVGLALLVGPYVTYLHGHTGSWSPTSKSQDVSIEAWRAVAEDNRNARDQILYAIDESGSDFSNDTTSLTALAREHPAEWLGIVKVNVQKLADLYLLPGSPRMVAVIPLPLLLAATWTIWRSRRRPAVLLSVLVGSLPLLTCVVFFTLPRYAVMATAVMAAFSAFGLVDLHQRLRGVWPRVLLVVVVLWTGVSYVAESWPLLPFTPNRENTDQVIVGEWVEQNSEPGDRIMTRSFHIQYYSRRPVVALPASGYVEMLEFARDRGVRFIVADERTIKSRRSSLYAALMVNPEPYGLREVASFFQGGRRIRVLELDPAAPPSELPPLPLGFVGD